jgi:hypothetical protein
MANTYIEVTSATNLNTGRIYINESLRALLTNFKSAGLPSTFTIDGVNQGIQDGMLYRSAVTNALYIADSVHGTASPIGGNFTRKGIGTRTEPTFAALQGSKALYEIGELVGILGTGKMYFRTVNTGADADFKELGAAQGYNYDEGTTSVVFTGPSLTGNKIFTTSNVGVGTSTPTQTLDVRGNVAVSNNVFIGSLIYHTGDLTTYSGYPVSTTGTFVVNTLGAERIRIDATGNLGIGTATARAKLEVIGNAFISTSTYSPVITASSILNVNDNTAQYSLTMNGNQINTIGFNGVAEVSINYAGYQSGTTQFRNFVVYNGKNSPIATFTGGTLDVSVANNFTAAGDITAFSDMRLKSNVTTIQNALTKVSQLRGVNYTKDSRNSIGVIAQEVEKIIPEVVITDEYKSVAYGNLVGLLIEAIKELQDRVCKLEERL